MIVNLNECLSFLGLTLENTSEEEQTLIQEYINLAEDWILRYINRKIEQTEFNEDYSGRGTNSLLLKNSPIISTEDITISIDGSKIDIANFKFDYNAGIIYFINSVFPIGDLNINVVYTAGYEADAIPSAIKIGIKTMLKILWERNDQNTLGTVDYHSGDAIVKYDNDLIPNEIKKILGCFKRYGFK
jgi:hypothetical protein